MVNLIIYRTLFSILFYLYEKHDADLIDSLLSKGKGLYFDLFLHQIIEFLFGDQRL